MYSVTVSPSRKLVLIGKSMISPWGSAINPRIPTSCRTWEMFPRAPEKAIMYTEFSGSVARKFLTTSSLRSSEVLFQVSITFWKRSTSVISPLVYFCSVIRISSSAASSSCRLIGGTCRSSTLIETPALVANRKPKSFSLSAICAVRAVP